MEQRNTIRALEALLILCLLAIAPINAQNVTPLVPFKIGIIAGPSEPNAAAKLAALVPTAVVGKNTSINASNNSTIAQPIIISAYGGGASNLLYKFIEEDPWGPTFGSVSQNNTASMKGANEEQAAIPIGR